MSRPTRKPTLLTLRNASTQISLSMPRTLIRTVTVRLLCIYCFRNHYSIPLTPNTECFGSDWPARTAHADLGRYITQSP